MAKPSTNKPGKNPKTTAAQPAIRKAPAPEKTSTNTPPPIGPAEPGFWRQHWPAAAILLGLAFILYAQALKFGYVLDDQIVITNNQFTKKGFAGIGDILTTESMHGYFGEQKNLIEGGRYRPLSIVSFAMEYQFFGLNPYVSHFFNILLYGLTAVLLYRLLCWLLPVSAGRRWYLGVPFLASLLFVTHPVHSEVVANIKGRDEIMTMLGALATVYCSLRYLSRDSKAWLLLSGVVFFLALLSKENALTFVAVIPLTLYFFTKAGTSRIVTTTVPLVTAAVLYLFMRYAAIGFFLSPGREITDIMNNPFYGMSAGEKLATIFYTLGLYVKLLFFPHPLTHDYYPYHIPILNWGDYRALGSLLLYLVLGGYALWRLPKKDVVAYGIWFYLFTLFIVSNLPVSVGTFMNERFIYMSSAGFCIAMAWLLAKRLPDWLGEKAGTIAGLAVALVFATGFSYKTIVRVPAWEDGFSLNSAAIKVSPNSARANLFMGTALYDKYKVEKDTAKARELIHQSGGYIKHATEILPSYGSALHMYSGILAEYFRYDNNIDSLLAGFYDILGKRNLLTITDKKTNSVFIDQYLDYLSGKSQLYPKLLVFYQKTGRMFIDKKDYANAQRYIGMGLRFAPQDPELLGQMALVQQNNPAGGGAGNSPVLINPPVKK